MDTNQILLQIQRDWLKEIRADKEIIAMQEIINSGRGTFAEAQNIAIRSGRILSAIFRRRLPDALVDGRLFEQTADLLIKQPLIDAHLLVASQAAEVMRALNEAAGIGIAPIVPDPNMDQINGIIHGISTAAQYTHYEESFMDQIENFAECVVDDVVHDNAEFQYNAGLSPTIERRAVSNCCTWCSRLAGVYDYASVSDRGNDVFRRHKNCHCQILFNPGDGSKRRQDVRTRRWIG